MIAAYILVSLNYLRGDAAAYQALDLFGGIFLVVSTIYFGVYPSTFVNGVWVHIAIFVLVRAVRK